MARAGSRASWPSLAAYSPLVKRVAEGHVLLDAELSELRADAAAEAARDGAASFLDFACTLGSPRVPRASFRLPALPLVPSPRTPRSRKSAAAAGFAAV